MFEFLKRVAALLTGNTVTVAVGLSRKQVVAEAASKTDAVGRPSCPTHITDDQARARLTELLRDRKYRFRSIDRLAKATGVDRWDTEKLLADIGARPSRRNPNLFGLTSRVGQRQRV